jgi:hypothetical protein
MAYISTDDQMGGISGLAPRYLRKRHAAAVSAQQTATQEEPAVVKLPTHEELLQNLKPVDAFTPDLRRRVAEAGQQGRRSSLVVAGPVVAGLGVVIWQIVTNIAHSTPVVLHTAM